MRELALFAGGGGGILGGHLLGWRTVCAVEIEEYQRNVLLWRQRDGLLPRFPIWDDICTFDGRPWRGLVDVVSGGFPCQNISRLGAVNGTNTGLEGEKSGLWTEQARIIREVRPLYAFVENTPDLTFLGLSAVLADLASSGYDAEWGVLSAKAVGAPHQRDRLWVLAADSDRFGRQRQHRQRLAERDAIRMGGSPVAGPWTKDDLPESRFLRVGYGLPHRVDRTRTLGNAQVPRVAAAAFVALARRGGWLT